MYNPIISVLSIFCVFDLQNAGSAERYSCYKFKVDALWKNIRWEEHLTNGLCESYCKGAARNYTYSGTYNKVCFCRETEPLAIDKENDDECTYECPGNKNDTCGGNFKSKVLSVSEIGEYQDSAERYSCYKFDTLWGTPRWIENLSNGLCERYCNDAYSGTVGQYCYCRKTELSAYYKVDDNECTYKCQGNNEDMCGGRVNYTLLTVSKIDRITVTMTEKSTQGTSTPSVSTRVSAMTEFMNMINSDTSSTIATKSTHYTIRELSSTTSQNANTDIPSVIIETSTPATRDQTTVTMTEKNTQGTSTPSVSTRVSAMTEFMNLITSDTSSAIATESSHYTTQDSSSTTSQNANNDISSVIIETSTPATADQTTVTMTEKNTQGTSTPSVSTRVSAMTEFMNMITSDTSSAIATKSTYYTTRELSSSTFQNANNDISSVIIETSIPAATDRQTVTMTEKNTQGTSTPSVSTRVSAMTEFMYMIISDMSSAIATKSTHYTTQDLSSTTSQNANNDISSVIIETSTPATTDRQTVTMTEKNTQGTSTPSVSTRVPVMTEFMNMITSDTSSAIATKSTHYTTQDLSSTTSQNANNDISSVIIETPTPATTDRTTVTMTEKNTQGTSTTSVSTRVSAMTEFINRITSETSSAIASKSTPYTTQDLSSTTSQNANNDISSVIIETSAPATTDRTTVTMTEKNTQGTITPSVSTRVPVMTEFMNMITSDKSSAIATKSTHYTTQDLSSTTSQIPNNDISSVIIETSIPATTGRTTVTMTKKNTQGTITPSVSTRVSAMTEFMNRITSDTSSAIATKSTHFTTQDLSSTTSQNANNDISSVIIETSAPATTDRTTVTMTEKNTQGTSIPSVSTRVSAMTEFMNIITSDTSSAIATKSTHYTIRDLSSTTSRNANNELPSVMTETSAPATTGLSTETLTVTITNKEATRTTSVSRRESTTTAFIRMITSDTSPLIVEPDIIQELLSTTNENVVTATSTVMTETSTQATTANGDWSQWNNWTFCVVNCVREDTKNGTQIRRRTCNGAKCSGKDMEERACSEPDICKGMRPRKLLCKCPKRLINTKWHFLDGKNITDAEVKKMDIDDFIKNIKSEISVDIKTVSKEIRKKNSSVDKRKSSQSIGWGCIVFLVLPMVFLITIDILNCCIHFRSRFGGRKRNRIKPISITQDQRVSTTPLQENVNAAESYYASRCGNNFHPDEMKRETYQRKRDDNHQLGRDEWLQYM